MALTIYRRHQKACVVHGMNLPARAKRLYVDCTCPIWMYGRTHDGLVPRQSTGLWDMAAAEALRLSMTEESKDEEVRGPTLAERVKTYLESRKHELSPKALGHYTPDTRPAEPKPAANPALISLPRLGGLHHRYAWREAA